MRVGRLALSEASSVSVINAIMSRAWASVSSRRSARFETRATPTTSRNTVIRIGIERRKMGSAVSSRR